MIGIIGIKGVEAPPEHEILEAAGNHATYRGDAVIRVLRVREIWNGRPWHAMVRESNFDAGTRNNDGAYKSQNSFQWTSSFRQDMTLGGNRSIFTNELFLGSKATTSRIGRTAGSAMQRKRQLVACARAVTLVAH
jgi:hypothetical protein